MTRSAIFIMVLDLCFLLVLGGCGGSTVANSGRVMQSLMVTPSSADAQNFPGAKVQFAATATFNMSPMTVQSPPVVWSIGSPFPTPPSMMGMMGMSTPMSSSPTVDTNGVAQCNGFTGIVAVQATAPANPNVPVSQMNAMMGTVAGVAQLTCP
jgi:hypothetical protein